MEPLTIPDARQGFSRQLSSPATHEQLTEFEKNIPIAGREGLIAEALEEFNKNTFHNYVEYLLVILDMPDDIEQYKSIDGFQAKVTQMLKNWTAARGKGANLGLLTENLRNHRSITDKVYKAIMASVGTSV